MLYQTVVAVSFLKTLFFPCYRSTDFEVHRNWLAVTSSLPMSKWYVEATSEWTLDYPPLFAWFELALAKLAIYFDPKMLEVTNLNYASAETIAFQRLSVIVTDFVLALGVRTCWHGVARAKGVGKSDDGRVQLLYLVFLNAGLLIVDHVHFQYNGFLFGVLLHSIGCMMQEKYIQSGFWFSALLNLKHIYLYCAPVYFFYLLKHYCLCSNGGTKFDAPKSFLRLAKLGAVVISVFAASFGPFVYLGQIDKVAARLFPFKRGLCHAYWAPNFWALYNLADKVAVTVAGHLELVAPSDSSVASMTGGLVQEFTHLILPSVPPAVTFVVSFASMVPCLAKLWISPRNSAQFLRALILCSFGSFMFGWHVHEKAILLVILPYTVLSFLDAVDAKLLPILSLTGHVSLMPLLFRHQEFMIKISLVAFHALLTLYWHRSYYTRRSSAKKAQNKPTLGGALTVAYVLGLVALPVFEVAAPLVGPLARYPFLTLLSYSIYCAMGLVYCWIRIYYRCLTL